MTYIMYSVKIYVRPLNLLTRYNLKDAYMVYQVNFKTFTDKIAKTY